MGDTHLIISRALIEENQPTRQLMSQFHLKSVLLLKVSLIPKHANGHFDLRVQPLPCTLNLTEIIDIFIGNSLRAPWSR